MTIVQKKCYLIWPSISLKDLTNLTKQDEPKNHRWRETAEKTKRQKKLLGFEKKEKQIV